MNTKTWWIFFIVVAFVGFILSVGDFINRLNTGEDFKVFMSAIRTILFGVWGGYYVYQFLKLRKAKKLENHNSANYN